MRRRYPTDVVALHAEADMHPRHSTEQVTGSGELEGRRGGANRARGSTILEVVTGAQRNQSMHNLGQSGLRSARALF